MAVINICLGMSAQLPCGKAYKQQEEEYRNSCKLIISYLYSHPEIPFTFYLSGTLIEWLEKNHPEFFMLVEELIVRKQIEILGGGYFDPLFPLIPPSDRVGQIELLTTALRKIAGKRPRGCWLPGSSWDPSLISSLNTCGLEYVLLDKNLITAEFSPYDSVLTPVIVEDMGKTIQVLPLDTDIFSDRDIKPEDAYTRLSTLKQDSVLCGFIPSENVASFFSASDGKKAWMDSFFELVKSRPGVVEFSLPSKVMKTREELSKLFISSGTAPSVNRWSLVPFQSETEQTDLQFLARGSVRRFLLLYPEALNLYSRMMYTHLLVNQIRGDRSRKKFAREELWHAQECGAYWYLGSDGVASSAVRQKAYKYLIQAEKIVRESQSFFESILCCDFDSDGIKEYLCQFTPYNAYLRLRGGSIFEFDFFPSPWNYTNVMSRTAAFDGVTDLWQRKLFIDHLTDDESFETLMTEVPERMPDTVFPGLMYHETSFDRVRHEITLKATGLFGTLKQQVSLKKKYIFSGNGIQVQYILKNESPLPLKGTFSVEFNLSLSGETPKEQKIEVVSREARESVPQSLQYRAPDSVSYLQILDCIHGTQFVFEPNENAGLSLMPLRICRPLCGKTENSYQATTLFLFWKTDLVPGYEMEKTISFKVKATNHTRKAAPKE